MNDFLKAMGQFGMEGYNEPETPMTELEEMNAEIAMEAELDDAYEQMDFANIVASTSQAEAMLTAMAEREVGLESNTGRDAAKVYAEFGLEGFGMEAVKDVVARKAYSGVASLKALINTCISWLKQLVGIEVATKKVFSGLERKAKAMDKSLRKVAKNVNEDKLKRDMPDYETTLTTLSGIVADSVEPKALKAIDDLKLQNAQFNTSDIKKLSDGMADNIEELSDKYDKNDTTDYEGSACYTHILKAVAKIKELGNSYKAKDYVKEINDRIKKLEKLRKEVDKNDSSIQSDKKDLSQYITTTITYLTKLSNYKKKALKLYVKCADDCLTMAKGIYATLV